MTPAYTVWQWDAYNGWQFMLGAPTAGAADQVRRALANYQPEKWYGIYGAFDMPNAFEMRGQEYSTYYHWGFMPDAQSAWIVWYSLYKLLRPTVSLFVSANPPHRSSEVRDAMPDFIAYDMSPRFYGV